MLASLKRSTAFLWSNFGYCANCIRKAFVVTAVAWLCTALFYLSGSSTSSYEITMVGACGFTALWVTHIVAFGLRSVNSRQRGQSANFSAERRNAVRMFVRAATAVTLASAISRHVLAADIAESGCGGFNGACNDRCKRQLTPSSPCEPCHSCGADCPQDNPC